MSPVTIEFYGIPRQRAGRAELAVEAGTLAEALDAVASACPGLRGLLEPDGRLSSHYLLSLNGRRFLESMDQRLQPGDHVLLLSADPGG